MSAQRKREKAKAKAAALNLADLTVDDVDAAFRRRMDCSGSNNGLSLAEIDKAVVELFPRYDHKPALMRAYKAALNGSERQFVTRLVKDPPSPMSRCNSHSSVDS